MSHLSLYQISGNYLQALDILTDPDNDLPSNAIADTLETLGGVLEDKAVNFAKFLRNMEAVAEAIGTPFKTASYVEKNRKYGDKISEQTISVKKPILVTGAHDSGKTRFIKRLYDDERAIYGAKIKHPAFG